MIFLILKTLEKTFPLLKLQDLPVELSVDMLEMERGEQAQHPSYGLSLMAQQASPSALLSWIAQHPNLGPEL